MTAGIVLVYPVCVCYVARRQNRDETVIDQSVRRGRLKVIYCVLGNGQVAQQTAPPWPCDVRPSVV